MAYGVVEYNEYGQPMCEICGKHFTRVVLHVRQKHQIAERDYKIQFGFDLKKGICSAESSERSRIKAFENYDKVIAINLKVKGQKSRFEKGSKGRTKEQVSEQTRIKLKERLKKPEMMKILQETGRKLGLSGMGNIKRWNK